MSISENTFHRLFSMSMYKTHKLHLGKLSFNKDFVNNKKGDLYPLLQSTSDFNEYIEDNRYILKNGCVKRLMGQFFPFATYEIDFKLSKGNIGFSFSIKNGSADIYYDNTCIYFLEEEKEEVFPLSEKISKLIISCRPFAFDVYTLKNEEAYYLTSFESETFKNSNKYENFKSGYVSFIASGDVEILNGSFYIDSGISQADIRPVTYEDGSAVCDNGKIYLTLSIRIQVGSFQGVFSWVPGTCEFDLVGAIFYDASDGIWGNDVAASIVFNRFTNKWNLWVCSFCHDHILGYSEFTGDPRFGVNVIDITLVNKKEEEESITTFSGAYGDEDPSFIFDKTNNRWLMAVCRLDKETKKYRYRFYEADTPFSNHKFIGEGYEGEETGGSFVNVDGEIHFICGNSYSKKSDYRIYSKDGMKNASFDFCDGGFRGWGTVIPIEKGSRKEYYWLTFDRHNGSDYNWSYGNIYCFKL